MTPPRIRHDGPPIYPVILLLIALGAVVEHFFGGDAIPWYMAAIPVFFVGRWYYLRRKDEKREKRMQQFITRMKSRDEGEH
jgi:hypothetical protein